MEKIMEPFWIGLLIGAAIGAGATAAGIFTSYHVQTRESWEESRITLDAIISRMHKLVAENAKVRVALATGAMAADAKKVAAVTMAALDAVIETGKVDMQECNAYTPTQFIEERIEAAIAEKSLGKMLTATHGDPTRLD
jgi:hypothetical protein